MATRSKSSAFAVDERGLELSAEPRRIVLLLPPRLLRGSRERVPAAAEDQSDPYGEPVRPLNVGYTSDRRGLRNPNVGNLVAHNERGIGVISHAVNGIGTETRSLLQ